MTTVRKPFSRTRRGLVHRIDLAMELAETEAHAALLAADIEANRVPTDARRAMFPHEVEAGVNFLSMASDINRAADQITTALGKNRELFLAILRSDLLATGSSAAVAQRLAELRGLGLNSIDGAADLLRAQTVDMTDLLDELARRGAQRVAEEAATQGVEIAAHGVTSVSGRNALEAHAARLVTEPLNDALRAVADAQLAQGTPNDSIEAALGIVDRAGRKLSEKPLGDLARQGAGAGNHIGRVEAGGSGPTPELIYASELIETPTICGPCSLIDGTEYESEAAARADYPLGLYARCEGGMRCRGTLVYVWAEAAPGG